MKREEAKQLRILDRNGMLLIEDIIDKIYDDFELRVCYICKHNYIKINKEFVKQDYCGINEQFICDSFGCNKWESR